MELTKAGKDVYDLMKSVLQRHHVDRLYMVEDQIEIIFREKASCPGGRVIQGKTKKAPPLLKALSESEAIFIIELAMDEWVKMDPSEKEAIIDHHLCSMMVDENAQTGNISYKIAPPDFIGYRGEIERHGVWRYLNTADEEDGETVIEKLFGVRED
jgi:hypothetical protein